MTVSVIVPHYSDLPGLARCLEALDAQDLPRDGFEIVVADNNSPEGEAAVAEVVAGRARLVVVSEKGAGPARNGGVAASRGEVLAFTDSDCVPEPQWLSRGIAALQDCDFAGGAMRVLVADETRLSGPEAFERVFAFDNQRYVEAKAFSVTANLFCPRRIFDAVGSFRVGVAEDLDWCRRAGAMGYRIGYASGAVVGHPARRTWGDLKRKWERLNAEAFGTEGAHRARWLLKSLGMPLSALAHTPKVLFSRALPNTAARVSALRTLYRLRFWRGFNYLQLLGRK